MKENAKSLIFSNEVFIVTKYNTLRIMLKACY